MSQFPLALSIEPRLLPLAVANGFHMDSKVHLYFFFFGGNAILNCYGAYIVP